MNQSKNTKIVYNHLRKKYISVIDLLGILTILIVTKDTFKKNVEVGEFIKSILNISFPGYVLRSRTLMAARVSRLVVEMDDIQMEGVKDKILKYLDSILSSDKDNVVTTRKNKKRMKMINSRNG